MLGILWLNVKRAQKKIKAKCKKALDAAANKRKEKAIRELNLREEIG